MDAIKRGNDHGEGTRRMNKISIALTSAAVIFGGCRNQAPSAPTSAVVAVSPAPSAPPTSASPVTALSITGPAAIAPNATGTFIATAHHADGSLEDVTARASWGVVPSDLPTDRFNVLRVVSAGVVQAGGTPSEALVQAFFSIGISTTVTVLVLPPGTFRVSGFVTALGSGAIDGASVEITSGAAAGQQVTSHNQGEYAFYGVAGALDVSASADGFVPSVRSVTAGDQVTSDFTLAPLAVPTDLSGAWTLTLSASPGCSASLPAIAQTRQFDAVLVQRATQLVGALSSPTLVLLALPGGAHTYGDLPGTVVGQTLTLGIYGDTGYGTWSYPDLFDQLSPTAWFGADGTVQGTVTGSEIQGTMAGDIEYWASSPPAGMPDDVCHAADHGVTLRRK
jgi:hypothetical protein